MRRRFSFRTWAIAIVVLATIALGSIYTASAATTAPKLDAATVSVKDAAGNAAVVQLQRAVGNTATVSYNNATGMVQFVRLQPGSLTLTGATAEAKVADFLARYGGLFGVRDAASQLRLLPTRQDTLGGMTNLSYQQVHNGVDVFAGVLRFHFTAAGELSAVNGVFIPDVSLSTVAVITESVARSLAVNEVRNNPTVGEDGELQPSTRPDALAATGSVLVVYRQDLAKDVPGLNHLAYEVEVKDGASVREFVFVDAQTGAIVDRMSAVHDALDRELYLNTLSNLIWEEGDAFPGTLSQDQQNIVNFSEDAYYLMFHAFGWDSYDDAGATMKGIDQAPISCPNASWNGTNTNFCTGVTSDDVVAHEWSHAYTEYTSGLIYQWQSGALNESYSDIFGETADLINGAQTDDPNIVRTTDACYPASGSVRWLATEDSGAFGGAIRDMWNPHCEGNDPAKVSDTQYYCGTADGGGVHSNSGVPNHGYALLVDGGTYNGQTINGIGLTKAAHIYWRAQSVYQTRVTDFADHADSLEAACSDLATAGTNLPGLSTEPTPAGPSGQVITTSDCQELAKVIAAVEFRTEPACNFQPMFEQDPPALCEGFSQAPINVFADNFEDGVLTDTWTLGNQGVYSGWPDYDWELASDLPFDRPGTAAFGIDSPDGACDAGANDVSGHLWMDSPVIAVPDTTEGALRLAWTHSAATELSYDGGNLKYRVNGGAWTVVPASAFIYNDYTQNLAAAPGNTNPLAGQPAFTGTDQGDVQTVWGQSQVNVGALGVGFGDTIQFRYDMGMDGCTGVVGWYVDDVQLYACYNEPTAVELSVLATAPAAPRVSPTEWLSLGIMALTGCTLLLLRRKL